MKDFNRRERLIISRAYHDAARICWERKRESLRGDNTQHGPSMAKHLMELMLVRSVQILKYGCHLPKKRKLT